MENSGAMQHSQIQLNAEILRIQTYAAAKSASTVWQFDESRICDYFVGHVSLPMSRVPAGDLVGREGVRISKNENKIYLGEVTSRKKHGKGVALYRDGRIYQGQFFMNEKNGFGCQLYANGNLYIGEYSQNKKHGKGSFYWFSLCEPACIKESQYKIEQYHGGWWGGLPDGSGQHQKANGNLYIGGFKNGLKHGEGVEQYANGDLYQGEFVNGLAEGFGEYSWGDGALYKGDFKQGYRNGYGVWQSNKGKQQYKGHYLLDKKHGYGIYDWGNGRIYKGNYVQDSRTGQGQLYDGQQLLYSGLWEDGRKMEPFTPEKRPFNGKKTINSHKSTIKSKPASRSRTKTAKPEQQHQEQHHTWKARKVISSGKPSRNHHPHQSSFQINFTHAKSNPSENLSVHRGCQACRKRPIKGQYSPHRLNPQQN